jgi:hypothetical protein
MNYEVEFKPKAIKDLDTYKMLTLKRLEEISIIPLHPQFITKNGKKEFAVIPYEEFEALQELIADIEDLMDLRTAKEEDANQHSVLLADVKKMLGL